MSHPEESSSRKGASRVVEMLLFCVAGIAVNLACSQVATLSPFPLYLDSVGTVLAAVLGGYVPGIVVGYITNLVNVASDPSTLFYGVINVLIAICAAEFARRGWLARPLGIVGAIVALAVVGGGLGSVLTWFLYGLDFATDASAPLAAQIYAGTSLGVFGSQLTADLLIDLPDKAIVVLVSVLVVRLIPQSWKRSIDFSLWQQAPLSTEDFEEAKHTKPRAISLRTKIVALVSVSMLVVSIATTAISFAMFHEANVEAQSRVGYSVSSMVADTVDGDRVREFLELGEEAPGYVQTEQAMSAIRDSFADIRYVYVYQILEDGCHVVFDLDSEDEEGSDPGEVVEFDQAFEPYLPALLAGEEIEPIVSDETYGWLLTAYHPVVDSAGECVAYAAVDISMDDLVSDELGFMTRIIALFAAFVILVCAIVLWLAEFSLVLPVNSIAHATGNFASRDEESRDKAVERIERLDIRTGDEVEHLYGAVVKSAQDTVRYIAEAHQKSETIERMQGNLIMVMADMVESRDKFTGDHIRKTAAYAKIILEELRREGKFADVLTDEYIEDVVHSAPLHDIGKIQVSDAILNKPGRLTDEEFEIMKSHTTAGQKIIESAVGAVSEATYLEEARNLAAYHHEKWNGSGYPYGLAGEEIPLSARVMAVADVFDALVSKRSYKEGFPIEKALDIIREGVGSHFDPQVAEAFLNVSDEARHIAESYGDGSEQDRASSSTNGKAEGVEGRRSHDGDSGSAE